jgi:uncharacterized membrane protein
VVPVRLRGWIDDLRDSLWLVPAAMIVGAVVLALVLVEVETPDWFPGVLTFGGTPEGARAVLSELAGATITVTGLVFSLTVIALQMAASQFTPRVLRTFLADRRTQVVLGGLLASAVYDVMVLRTVRSTGDEVELFVPGLAVTVALLLAGVAVGLLVFFLHHVTSQLRVDLVMGKIAAETHLQLRKLDAPRDRLPDHAPPEPPPGARTVVARRSGYVQTVDVDALADIARDHGVRLRLRPGIGEAVSAGTTLAWTWPATAGVDGRADDHQELTRRTHGALHLGPDRTESHDLTFGLQQLTDIAVKALSPSINDPTTARQAVEHLAAVLVELADHPLGADLVEDDDSQVRAAVPRPTFAAHVAMCTEPIRRYGREEPTVLRSLAGLLTDLAERVADHADRAAAVATELDRLAACTIDDPDEAAALARDIAIARATVASGVRPASGASVAGPSAG